MCIGGLFWGDSKAAVAEDWSSVLFLEGSYLELLCDGFSLRLMFDVFFHMVFPMVLGYSSFSSLFTVDIYLVSNSGTLSYVYGNKP